jgi:hypothetical protein
MGCAISVLMLSSASIGAAAQAEPCTGTLEFGSPAANGGIAWEASDPRLSGTVAPATEWSFYEAPGEDRGAHSQAVTAGLVITNDGGTWHCVSSDLGGPEPDVDADAYTLVFQGGGGYDGLVAHVRLELDGSPFGFSGLILEGDPPEDPTLAG